MKPSTTGRYLRSLIADAGVVEIRHLPTGQSGQFNDVDKLVSALGSRVDRGNLYSTLNRPTDQTARNSFGTSAYSDSDISRITRIPFDFDPCRPTGCASTDEELKDASARCDGLLQALYGLGWPIPLKAMSGNGYHLQYRCALQANAETKEILKLLYRGLGKDYSDDVVDFDTTVRNPSRILRLYGTLNRKGKNLPDRPWRRSRCDVPRDWRQVTRRQIEKLAERYARKPAPVVTPWPSVPVVGRGDYSQLDVVRWFHSHGLYEHHIEANKHSVRCPWEGEHSMVAKNDTIVFESDGGWPGFHCKHSHCDGRSIRDVMVIMPDADAFCGQPWRPNNV